MTPVIVLPDDYVFRARPYRVSDGDTFWIDADLGARSWQFDLQVRIVGMMAPEYSQVGGREAAVYLSVLLQVPVFRHRNRRPSLGITPAPKVRIVSHEYEQFDKYGRLLATVYQRGPTGWEEASVAEKMIAAGHATIGESKS